MNKKFILSGLLTISALTVVGVMVTTQAPQSSRLLANTPGGEWHHYSAQDPSLDIRGKAFDKGTKEYWVECGGGYQFTEPASGTVIDKAGAPDTSEFVKDDDRWSYYCDIHGHSYDELGVCEYCNVLKDAEQIGDKAIKNAVAIEDAGTSGFESVYSITGLSNGAAGTTIDLTLYSKVYFSIYHDISYIIAFGGNNGNNPVFWQADWYNVMITRTNSGWEAHYKRAYEKTWNADHSLVDETGNQFASVLKFYNWDALLPSANVKCTEVYGVLTPHSHTEDEKGICTVCKELVGATKIADSPFGTILEPENNPGVPAGFETSVRAVAHHNTSDCMRSVDLSNKSKVYFAIYSPDYSVQYCDGGGKSFSANEWAYLYLDHTGGSGSNHWTVYGRKASENDFTLLKDFTTGGSTNLKWLFTIICWGNSGSDFNVYSTEMYALPF